MQQECTMSATSGNVGYRPRFIATFPSIFLTSFFLFLNIMFGPCPLRAGNNVRLTWTAPGDDANRGRATRYDLRYSAIPIGTDTANWWNFALSVDQIPLPSWAGRIDSCVIYDLPIDRFHYFAVKTADDVFNWSKISNIGKRSPVLCIDINDDGSVNILDAIYLLDMMYKDGPELPPGVSGDINRSGTIDILDAVFILRFCYEDGPAPDCS
jgi:hypothetical protein